MGRASGLHVNTLDRAKSRKWVGGMPAELTAHTSERSLSLIRRERQAWPRESRRVGREERR